MRYKLMIVARTSWTNTTAAADTTSVTNCFYCKQLWDVEAGSVISTLTRHEDPVYSVAFSPR
jgi:WD40 repeat protein